MKHLFFSLFVVLLFVSCSSKSEMELVDYPSLATIFTEQEVADLQTLLDLFEKEIGIHADATVEEKVAGYSVFNKQVSTSMQKGELADYPLSNEQKNRLLEVLHIGTFRSIWSLGSGIYLTEDRKNIPMVSFSVHTAGKFIDLLTALEKEYPRFSELRDELQMAGDISPSFANNLFSVPFQYNLRDARVRLVYMICLLGGEWKN